MESKKIKGLKKINGDITAQLCEKIPTLALLPPTCCYTASRIHTSTTKG